MTQNSTRSKFLESTFQVRLFLVGHQESVMLFGKNLQSSLPEFDVDLDPLEIGGVHVMLFSKFQELGLCEWKGIEEQVRRAVDKALPANTALGVLGISFVYQVVFDRINDDTGIIAIEELRSSKIDIVSKPYSQSIPGGLLYLLHLTPMETLGQKNFLPVLRYLAVCEQENEEELNKNLSFLSRDIALYKAHHNLNIFRLKTAKEKLQKNLRAIDQDVQGLFEKQDILGDETKAALEKLSKSLRHLLRIYIDLTSLATSNSQQYVNYRHSFDGEETAVAQGQVWRFLRERMRILYEEIDIKITECKAVLEATHQAITMVQTRIDQADEALEREQDKRRQRTEELLAYLGIGIALPELISYDLVQTLLESWHISLRPICYFFVQLLLIVILGWALVKIIRNATNNFGKEDEVKEINKFSDVQY